MIDKNDKLYKEWRDWMKLHHIIAVGDSPNPESLTGRRKEIAIELEQIAERQYELRREIRETFNDLDKKIKEKTQT